jgi:DNA-binding transcriptional LysR family regulator
MDILAAMRLFVRVVETGSFSTVARELDVGQPTVSKQIAALESYLGARLVSRTTRHVAPTEDGRLYYEQCRRVLGTWEESEATIGRRRAAPTGLLRIGTPPAFGRIHVAPRIRPFLDRHPKLSAELVMDDRFSTLIDEEIDVTLRLGHLADERLVARRIGTTTRVVAGSADYFARAGEPQTPEDLAEHNCLLLSSWSGPPEWHFQGPGGARSVHVGGNFRANNFDALREAVIGGLGIALMPIWLFREEMASGRVRAVLRGWEPPRLPIHAVYPARPVVPAKVRAFIDFLEGEFRLDPLISSYSEEMQVAA